MAFPNIYMHRKVGDSSAKGCEICFKSSTSVLITPENKDFFYVCPGHLTDRGFCSPIIDHAAIEAKKKEDAALLEKQINEEKERLKKEYEAKKGGKTDTDKASSDKSTEKNVAKGEANKQTKEDEKEEKQESAPAVEEPRVFSLHRNFFQGRLEKKRQLEMAKRNRERMANPSFFPSVPKDLP